MANPKRHSKPVDWAEALTAELAGPKYPPNAKTARELHDLYRAAGGKNSYGRFRHTIAARADLESMIASTGKTSARYYWPKP